MYSWDFSRSVGAGSATMRNTRGLTRSVIALMTPPFPAVSRPSKTTTIFKPLCCTHSCSFTSSACSFFRCSSYSLFFILPRFSSAAAPAPFASFLLAFAGEPSTTLFAAICHTSRVPPTCRAHPVTSMRLGPLLILQVPATAQRLVEIHDRYQLIALRLRERILRGEQRLLRIEHLEVAR